MNYLNLLNSGNLKMKFKIDVSILKFLLLFLFSMGSLYVISIKLEPFIPLFNQVSTANVLYSLLRNAKVDVTLNKNRIDFANFSLVIVSQCTGILELISLFSCIFVFPALAKDKLKGILIVIPLIYILNMLRLLLLSFIGIYSPSAFDIVHKYIFQVTFVSLVIVIWMVWIDMVKKNEK